jgi:hypothetical protein
MAEEMKRVEIGFSGGQVVSVRMTGGTLGDLRKAVGRDQGWHDIEIEDGAVALDLSQVVFLRTAGAPHTIGFSGN